MQKNDPDLTGNDNIETGLARAVDNIIMGVRFFSRLPIPKRPHMPPQLSRMAFLLPIASLIIGFLPFLLILTFGYAGKSDLFAAVIGLSAFVIITGAMHEDGLADSTDGLFGASEPARRLEIMKDSHVGAFGVMAIVLSLLLRIAAVAALLAISPVHGALLWLTANVGSRSGALWLSYLLPPARTDGLSHHAGKPRFFALTGGSLITFGLVLVSCFWLLDARAAFISTGIAALLIFGFTRYCRQKIGGQTGDLIGALQQILEIAFLASFMLLTGG